MSFRSARSCRSLPPVGTQRGDVPSTLLPAQGRRFGTLLAILLVLLEIAHKKLRKIIVLSSMLDSITRTNKIKHLSLLWLGAESSGANKSRHAGARAFLRPRNRPESILVDNNPAAARAGRQAAYHHATVGGNPKTGSE